MILFSLLNRYNIERTFKTLGGRDMSKEINAFLICAASNDMDAFGKLYEMLSVRIFNYARAITKNREMAEDVTHDVFMQIFKKAAHLAKMANPIAYIMVITRNRSFDHLKCRSRVTASLEDVSEESSVSFPYARLLIWDAFSRLPSEQREIVYLCHVCGHTQKEAAKITGVSLITVKRRCAKALTQLQAYFNQEKEDLYNEFT
jgi:RNA polymerase sigma-70 factor (ECF subfamily)